MHSMDLRFHIGVHKTGSTRLQKDLNGRREHLNNRGISVFGPKEIRTNRRNVDAKKLFPLEFPNKGVASAVLQKIDAFIQQSLVNKDRIVVFSDEEFAGTIDGILKTGNLYADIGPRIKSLADLSKNRPTTFIITVRNYADFFASLYAHRTKRRPLAEFETLKQRFLILKRRWTDLIDEILAAAPNNKLIVFSFEDGVKNTHSALCHVIGERRLREIKGDYPVVLESPSAAAVDALNARKWFRKGSIARRAQVLAQFPRSENSKFDPWTTDERAELTAKYHDDLNALATRSDDRLVFSNLQNLPDDGFAQNSMKMREAANVDQ